MPKLPGRMKLAYGATDFGFSMAGTIIMVSLLYYAVNVLKLDPLLAGGILMAGKIWDAAIDPFIGYRSDRTRSRWGRRRPFFLWFTLPYALSFILIWILPPTTDKLLLAGLFALANISFITFFSLLAVPYNTLGPEMTRDYDERTSLTSYRMAFSIIGGLVAAPAVPLLVGIAVNERTGYMIMGAGFGLLLMIFPLFAFFGTRETVDVPENAPSLRSGIRAALKNRPFLLALTAFLVSWTSFDIIGAVLLFYINFALGMEAQSSMLLLAIFATAAACLPLWIKISNRFDKKTAYMLGLGELALVLAILAFFAPPRPWLIYALAIAAGFGVSAAHVIPYSIIPDAVEYDEYHTGENREGVYFGLITFVQQLGSAAGVFLVGLFLKTFGFDEELTVQSTRAVTGIRLALGALPALLIAVGVAAVARYPITRDAHQRFVAAIAERNRAKVL